MLQQADKMGCREFVTAQVFFYQNKINRHYLVKISNIYVNVNVTLITDNNAFHQNYFEYNDTYGVDDDYYHFDHDEDDDDNG